MDIFIYIYILPIHKFQRSINHSFVTCMSLLYLLVLLWPNTSWATSLSYSFWRCSSSRQIKLFQATQFSVYFCQTREQNCDQKWAQTTAFRCPPQQFNFLKTGFQSKWFNKFTYQHYQFGTKYSHHDLIGTIQIENYKISQSSAFGVYFLCYMYCHSCFNKTFFLKKDPIFSHRAPKLCLFFFGLILFYDPQTRQFS